MRAIRCHRVSRPPATSEISSEKSEASAAKFGVRLSRSFAFAPRPESRDIQPPGRIEALGVESHLETGATEGIDVFVGAEQTECVPLEHLPNAIWRGNCVRHLPHHRSTATPRSIDHSDSKVREVHGPQVTRRQIHPLLVWEERFHLTYAAWNEVRRERLQGAPQPGQVAGVGDGAEEAYQDVIAPADGEAAHVGEMEA